MGLLHLVVAGGSASKPGVFLLMALHAPVHRGIVFLPQRVARCNRSVTGFAGQARLEVDAVAPKDVLGNCVNSHPGNRSPGLGEFREFLDGRFIVGDSGVTRHACVCRGKPHSCARFRIDVAVQAIESDRRMGLVAVR